MFQMPLFASTPQQEGLNTRETAKIGQLQGFRSWRSGGVERAAPHIRARRSTYTTERRRRADGGCAELRHAMFPVHQLRSISYSFAQM